MSDAIKLAEELEAAGGPSREMDARIEALFTDERGTRPLAFFRHQIENGHKRPCPFTSSVDAAMLLVPEGWMRCFHLFVVRTQNELWEADLGPYSSAMVRGQAATPALALCAAALKAGE